MDFAADPLPVEIVGLLVSPVHAFAGRPDDGPLPDAEGARPERVDVRAGLGPAVLRVGFADRTCPGSFVPSSS